MSERTSTKLLTTYYEDLANRKEPRKGRIKKILKPIAVAATAATLGAGIHAGVGMHESHEAKVKQEKQMDLVNAAGEFTTITLDEFPAGSTMHMDAVRYKMGGLTHSGGLAEHEGAAGHIASIDFDVHGDSVDIELGQKVKGVYENGHGASIDVDARVTYKASSAGIDLDVKNLPISDIDRIIHDSTTKLERVGIYNMPVDKSKHEAAASYVIFNKRTGEIEVPDKVDNSANGVSDITDKLDYINRIARYVH